MISAYLLLDISDLTDIIDLSSLIALVAPPDSIALSPDVSQYFVACAFILSYLRNPLPLDPWTLGQQTLALQAYELLDESCVRFGHAITFTKSNVEMCTIHHYFHKLVTLEECVAFDLELLGTSLQVWNSKTILAKPFSVFNLAVSQTFLGYSITDIWKQNRKSTLQRFRVLTSCSAENLRLRQHLGRDIHQ